MATSAFMKVFSDPDTINNTFTTTDRAQSFAMAYSYYRSTIFSRRNGYDWSPYLNQRELYKHTRLIYNPVPQIVDFYVDNIWQRARNAENESLITALADNTDVNLVNAIAQLDQWGVWLSEMQKAKRYAAATGSLLIEGVDDVVREKITHKSIWAGYVTEIELNDAGDVLSYTVEYDAYNHEAKESYKYKKVVTKESFSYFYDDRPFTPEGKTDSIEENPYGFCFAVWIKHIDDGGDYGMPAFHDFNKVDEVSQLAAHLHDNIRKNIESPKLIATDSPILPVTGASSNSDGTVDPQDPRLNWMVLKTGAGADVLDMSGVLKLAEAHPYLKDLLLSFTDDYPELQAASIIKENSQLSGAALERMLTPSQNRLDRAAANYDAQLIKLRQMQIAVGGMRANNQNGVGGWTRNSKQQQLFKPYSLDSYEQGKLDFNLKRSLLVEESDADREDLLAKKLANANAAQGLRTLKSRIMMTGVGEKAANDEITQLGKEDAVIASALATGDDDDAGLEA